MSELVCYRGKPIDDMTIDELRAALVESLRYARALMELHQAHTQMLRNVVKIADDQQQRLFLEYAQ